MLPAFWRGQTEFRMKGPRWSNVMLSRLFNITGEEKHKKLRQTRALLLSFKATALKLHHRMAYDLACFLLASVCDFSECRAYVAPLPVGEDTRLNHSLCYSI